MMGIPWLAEELLASQEGLRSMQLSQSVYRQFEKGYTI